MKDPFCFHIQHIHWQLFGTLTFKSEKLSNNACKRRVIALIRYAAIETRTHFKHLIWCLRMEHGHRFGRKHFHFLLAGLPSQSVTEVFCRLVESHWSSLGGGIAQVNVYDHRLNGCGYVSKCSERLPFWNPPHVGTGGDPSDLELMLSKSAIRYLKRRYKKTERRLAH